MTHRLQLPPPATIRTQVTVPLRFADGFATTARRVHLRRAGRRPGAPGARARRPPSRPAPADRLDRLPLVRPHSECLTGDVFGSQRCDCGPQLREAVERIARGRRLPALPAPGGPRHRALRQARRLRAAGRRAGHLRGQPRARVHAPTSATTPSPPRCCGARRRAARAAQQQPRQGRAAGPARGRRDRGGADRRAPHAANARYLATKAARGAHTFACAPEDPTPADQPPHKRGPGALVGWRIQRVGWPAPTRSHDSLMPRACGQRVTGPRRSSGCLSGGGRTGRCP